MENLRNITIIFLLAFGVLASAAQTKSPSVLLQEGLYAEEIEGDLDAAIKIYRQVIAESKETQLAAAQATYRIGMCYLKKGEQTKALSQFNNLVSRFPEQKAIVDKARKQLAKLRPPTRVFEPVPVDELVKSGKVPCFEVQLYDNTALDLDSGQIALLKDEWPDRFDVAWDNDGGGVLMKKPGSGVRFLALPSVEKQKWDDAICMARSDIDELLNSNARGIWARQGKCAAVLTNEGNLAVIRIGGYNEKRAMIYGWVEKIPAGVCCFGPVIERVLNDDGVGQDFLLDLDTGRLYSVSDAKKWSETSGAGQEKSLEDFIMESGVDLVGETSKKSLMGIDMIAIPTHNERWNMSPEDVIEQVSLGKPGTPVALSADGELPKIFVFKTGQGGMGILQITEMQDGKAPRHFKIRYKMLQQKLDLTAHEIFIPDADTRGVGVVLDLASGELLPAGQGQEQLTIFRKLGKGDLAYDQVLICLRGAKAKLIVSDTRGEHLTDLKIEGQMEDMTAYKLELRTIPGRFVITTAEGNNYPLTILSADSKGLTLRREKVPLSTVDFDSMDFWQGQIHRYMEAVRTLEGRFITDRQSFGEGQTEPSSHERYRINFKWNRDNAWYDYSWQRLDSRFDDLPERMIKGREFSWWVHSDGRYITKAKAEAKVGLPMWRGGFSPEDEWWPGDALTINPIAELVASDFLRNVKYQLKSGLKPEKHSVDTKDNHILEIPVTGLGGEKGHVILTVDWDNGFKLLSLKVKAKEYYGEDEVLMGQWSDYIRSNDIWIAKKAIQYNYPDSGQADGNIPEVEEQYVVIAERIIANRHIPAEEFDYQPPVGKHLSDQITGSSYIIWPDFEKIKALGGKARVSIKGLAFLDGRPIENVLVSTHTYYDPDQESQKAVQCKTSQDGGFSLEGLLPGFTYRVKAATNSGMVGVETVQMPDDGRDYLNLRIDLVTGLTVTGKVSGPGNEPVANAVVLFRGHPPVTTDQNGTYTINGLTTGTGYEVQAAAKGYAPFDPGGDVIVRSYQVKLNENGEPQNLDIQLDRERFIYGRVLDKQGKGVEGVRIFVGDWPFGTCSQWVNTYTDKTGQFRIGNLANQEYSVVIGSLGSRKIKPSESPVEIVYDVPEQKR